jgi:hypothetical protein
MASAASNCSYKSVTLAVGETFTLPPGAEIVSVTGGLESFTSTCPKPESLETPICYKTVFQDTDEINSRMPPYNVVYVDGIMVNNIMYPFTNGPFTFNNTGSGTTFVNGLNAKIASTSIGALITNLRIYSGAPNGWQRNGEAFEFYVDTIPSIGDTMQWYGYGDGGRSGSPGTAMTFRATKCS